MTRDDIIRMAREAGFRQRHNSPIEWHMVTEDIERFAALVAAHEREECAKACENLWLLESYPGSGALDCAHTIRARGTP